MEAILVLGAAGFIGSHLVSKLAQTHRVVGYDRYVLEAQTENDRCLYLKGDFCTEREFHTLFCQYKISCIYHCISTTTPQEGTSHATLEVQENVLPTLRLLEAASDCGVKRVIFLSSGGTIYGEGSITIPHKESEPLLPICSYGVQKLTIEKYLQLYQRMRGLDVVIARISNPYGLCLQDGRTQGIIPVLLRQLYRNEEITLLGNTVRDYIYIEDVVLALAELLTYQGNEIVFNIGSGVGVGLNELVNQIETVTGCHFINVHHETARRCDVRSSVLDCSLAKKEFGWYPHVTLESGIRKTITQMAQVGQI